MFVSPVVSEAVPEMVPRAKRVTAAGAMDGPADKNRQTKKTVTTQRVPLEYGMASSFLRFWDFGASCWGFLFQAARNQFNVGLLLFQGGFMKIF
jgi:hypothetical protein